MVATGSSIPALSGRAGQVFCTQKCPGACFALCFKTCQFDVCFNVPGLSGWTGLPPPPVLLHGHLDVAGSPVSGDADSFRSVLSQVRMRLRGT